MKSLQIKSKIKIALTFKKIKIKALYPKHPTLNLIFS